MTSPEVTVGSVAALITNRRSRVNPWCVADPATGENSVVWVPAPVTPLGWCDWDPNKWEGQWTYSTELSASRAERRFLVFDGAHTRITLRVDGRNLGTQTSGFLPVSFELPPSDSAQKVDVDIDSSWMLVPPMGSPRGHDDIDFYIPGGMHRAVWLEETPNTRIADLHVSSTSLLTAPAAVVSIDIDTAPHSIDGEPSHVQTIPATVTATVVGTDGAVAHRHYEAEIPAVGATQVQLELELDGVRLWSPESPELYTVFVSVQTPAGTHTAERRTGFRDISWATDGFRLNGRLRTLVGLNRHELFPYSGFAVSDRAARNDARILKEELGCDIVRTSHYPPTPAFLDACDELGLLVFEEVPGWQYAGTVLRDQTYGADHWRPVPDVEIDLGFRREHLSQVERMIRRDRSRPSVIVWGVFLNEARAYTPSLWAEVNELVGKLDDRPTSGATRFRRGGHERDPFDSATDDEGDHVWPFAVFGYNDYGQGSDGGPAFLPAPPYPYLITEAVGQFPDFRTHFNGSSSGEALHAQALHHASAIDRAAGVDGLAGVITWVAFDYQTPYGVLWGANGEGRGAQGHRLKSAGVADTFRNLRPGAAPYRALVDPAIRPVIAPAFIWDWHPVGQPDGPPHEGAIASNCDVLEVRIYGHPVQILRPRFDLYPHSPRPLFIADLSLAEQGTDCQIDGYIDGELRARCVMSSDTTRDVFSLGSDDDAIYTDGTDTTRVHFGITDRYGNPRFWRDGLVSFDVEPGGELHGENPFDGRGTGCSGAVWIGADLSTATTPTRIRVQAHHPDHPPRSIFIDLLSPNHQNKE